MNFTNINDPAGLRALLEQLRSSQAWQEALHTQPANAPGPSGAPGATTQSPPVRAVHSSTAANLVKDHEPSAPPSADAPDDPSDAPSLSVASLLSQLQQNTSTPAARPLPHVVTPQILLANTSIPIVPAPPRHASADAASAPLPSSARREDLRSLSFQQALPHLVRFAEDPGFSDAISTMRREQADLERLLWDERGAIVRKHEEKVKVACTKASLVGGTHVTGLTPYEADMMSDAFRQELRKFDAQRVLHAWDSLVAKQQARLEALGVPAMFPTTSNADRERQQRVIQVLLGISGNDDS